MATDVPSLAGVLKFEREKNASIVHTPFRPQKEFIFSTRVQNESFLDPESNTEN